MENRSKQRIFLVGCPRSGTTLLQSLLAAHPQIASFPESHFFANLIPRNRLLRILGFASPKVKPRLKQFLQQIERNEKQFCLPKFELFVNRYVQTFVAILDTLTEEQNKTIWLEKTPCHLHFIKYIEKYLPEAKFIHILRNGSDVIASMYEVTQKYPQAWGGERNIDTCIRRWVKDTALSYSHLYKSNHILIRYENLLAEPKLVLKNLTEFIDVSFDESMLKNYNNIAEKIILENEPWKELVTKPIKISNNKKIDLIFDENQKKYILEQISDVYL
jgi:hypothetical protein